MTKLFQLSRDAWVRPETIIAILASARTDGSDLVRVTTEYQGTRTSYEIPCSSIEEAQTTAARLAHDLNSCKEFQESK